MSNGTTPPTIPPNGAIGSPWNPSRLELRDWFQREAPSLGDLYEGAVELLYQGKLPGRIRLIAHAMREIWNRLPDYLTGERVGKRLDYVSRVDTIEKKWNEHRQMNSTSASQSNPVSPSSQYIPIPLDLYNELDLLISDHGATRQRPLDAARRLYEGLDPQNTTKMGDALRPVLLQWVEITRWSVAHAHDSGQGKRDGDYNWDEIRGKFELMELALRSIVGAFFVSVKELDEILAETNYTEQINKVVALLARPEQSRYFLDRLENPEWVLPLKAKGIFSSPPQLVEDGEMIRIVPWPASQYLARMAKKSSNPSSIMDVVLSVPETENVRVRTDLVEAALGLPGSIAVRLVPKAVSWIDTPYNILLHERLGDFIAHLAGEGEVDKALDLARELLVVIPRQAYKEAEQTEQFDLSEPKTRIRLTDYQSIIEANVGVLAEKAGLQAVDTFSGFLEIALRYSVGPDNEATGYDLSYIWRPAIEDHEQNHDRGIRGILVSAIRDISQLIASRKPAQTPALISKLEDRKWTIFRRLALHLMRLFPQACGDKIKTCLTDKKMFEEHAIRHEYALLLKEQFRNLDEASRLKILVWIEEGPDDLDDLIEYRKRETGVPPSAQEIERYKQSWQLKQLILINDFLPDEWKWRYRRLNEELGVPEHPEFEAFFTTERGPNSPKLSDEVSALSPEELRDYLIRWVPQKDKIVFGPSKKGLGRELSSVVARDPQKYLKDASWYAELDPTYVRSILQGVAEGLGKGHRFEWEQVLNLSAWVVAQERTIQGRIVARWDADPDWGWARNAIARLLAAGFRDKNNSIPPNFKTNVWSIISVLTEDPHPTSEKERAFSSRHHEGNDIQHAINTVRGTAFETMIGYALWVRRSIAADPDADSLLARGFDNLPEVRAVLDAHLKIDQDPSPAIRAVYGSWFPWLVLLDPSWSKQVVAQVFPINTIRFWKAAWEAYILFRQPYDDVLDVMMPVYKQAVERIGAEAKENRHPSRAEEHLAQHLMTFYWRGKLTLKGTDQILTEFYNKADDRLRGEAIEFIGRSLKNTAGPLEAIIVQKITSLWEWRLGQAQKAPVAHQKEMANFGWWFGSGKLDQQWAIKNLFAVLKLSGRVEADYLVLERLAELAEEMTQEVLECARMMIEGDKQGWDIPGWDKELRHILGVAMNSPISADRITAAAIINRLGERGYLNFRSLLGNM